MVRWVDAKVLEPQERIALALEDVWDPAEWVVEVPESNADAGGVLDASPDGLGSVSTGTCGGGAF